MRDQKNPGRELPGKECEPRAIAMAPAAHDQTKASPQSVYLDDSATDSVAQFSGVDRIAESESDGGSGESGENPVVDTGWREYRGWKVRMVVLGGKPDSHRRAWFAGKFLPR